MNLNELNDDDLVDLYPKLLEELKDRGIIRTNNLVGELGEYIARMHYKNNSNFPQIQLNLKSTKNIDATSINGERYAIKSTSGSITGVFDSLPLEDNGVVYFEYLIIVGFNKDYSLKEILEVKWSQFLKYRKMKNPENKWYMPITNKLRKESKKVY